MCVFFYLVMGFCGAIRPSNIEMKLHKIGRMDEIITNGLLVSVLCLGKVMNCDIFLKKNIWHQLLRTDVVHNAIVTCKSYVILIWRIGYTLYSVSKWTRTHLNLTSFVLGVDVLWLVIVLNLWLRKSQLNRIYFWIFLVL